jgi:hypothetical protein
MRNNHRLEAQDWVCLSCNNLNYSFRKVCNRCKITTREDNHNYSQHQYYSIYYQPPYYPFQEDPNNQDSHILTQTQVQPRNRGSETHSDHEWVGRKDSGSEASTGSKWDIGDEEVMALLPNAWEGLQVGEEPPCSFSESSA